MNNIIYVSLQLQCQFYSLIDYQKVTSDSFEIKNGGVKNFCHGLYVSRRSQVLIRCGSTDLDKFFLIIPSKKKVSAQSAGFEPALPEGN